jgi:hypothetical protein
MKSYLENQEKSKIFHEQRKTELMREGILNNLTTKESIKKETQEKLEKAKETNNKDELENLEINLKNIDEQIKEFEKKKDDLDTQIKDLADQIGQFEPAKMSPPKIINV